jgi:hypothetical protein
MAGKFTGKREPHTAEMRIGGPFDSLAAGRATPLTAGRTTPLTAGRAIPVTERTAVRLIFRLYNRSFEWIDLRADRVGGMNACKEIAEEAAKSG